MRRRYFSLPRGSYHTEEFAGAFGLGLNADAQPYALSDGEARALTNVTSTVRGSIRKRDGCTTFSTAGTNLTSLYGSATPNKLIAAGGTVLYAIDTAGTISTIKTAMTSGALWSWVNAPASGGQGPLYGVNGTDAQQWDGVAATTSAWTASSGTFPAGAKYLASAGNRVFAAGMTSYAGLSDPSSAVVWTDLASPRSWPAANTVMLDPGDGEAITGIGTVGPYLLVTKPSKIWLVFDLDSGANRRLGVNVGGVAHRSMVETPFGTFWLGRDAIYKTDGSQAEPITRNRLTSLIASILTANRGLAAGAYFNGHYYLAVSTSGSVNNLLIDYDILQNSFWVHQIQDTQAPAQMAVWEGDGSPKLYGARAGGTLVSKLFVPGVAQDNGVNFTGSWSSKFFDFGWPHLRKRMWACYFDGSGHIQASVSKDFQTGKTLATDADFSSSASLWGAGASSKWGVLPGVAWGGTQLVKEAKIITPGLARAWSVTVGNATAQPFELDSIVFNLADKVRKGA